MTGFKQAAIAKIMQTASEQRPCTWPSSLKTNWFLSKKVKIAVYTCWTPFHIDCTEYVLYTINISYSKAQAQSFPAWANFSRNEFEYTHACENSRASGMLSELNALIYSPKTLTTESLRHGSLSRHMHATLLSSTMTMYGSTVRNALDGVLPCLHIWTYFLDCKFYVSN